MASNIYTVTLWQASPTVGGPTVPGPAVPSGYVWVIRDVALAPPAGTDYLPTSSPGSLKVNGIPIAETPAYGTLSGLTYRWNDVRQVVTVSDAWEFVSSSQGWQLRVGGYQLTAP